MAAGLLFLTFSAFHGTSGNQTENNVNIFLIVKLFDWTFCLLVPQNHISLIDVAAVGTKNYAIVTGTEHAKEYMKDHIYLNRGVRFEFMGIYFG